MQGTFTGKASLNKMESKYPYYSSGKTKNGDKYHRFNLAVTDDKNNRITVELFGMVQDEIKTMNTDKRAKHLADSLSAIISTKKRQTRYGTTVTIIQAILRQWMRTDIFGM